MAKVLVNFSMVENFIDKMFIGDKNLKGWMKKELKTECMEREDWLVEAKDIFDCTEEISILKSGDDPVEVDILNESFLRDLNLVKKWVVKTNAVVGKSTWRQSVKLSRDWYAEREGKDIETIVPFDENCPIVIDLGSVKWVWLRNRQSLSDEEVIMSGRFDFFEKTEGKNFFSLRSSSGKPLISVSIKGLAIEGVMVKEKFHDNMVEHVEKLLKWISVQELMFGGPKFTCENLEGKKVVKGRMGVFFFENGFLHREDGPAVIKTKGWIGNMMNSFSISLFKKIVCGGDLYWFENGFLHREDGPAVEYESGTKEFWKRGRSIVQI